MSDDKPRRSWRDLDRQRDRSTHRREEPRQGGPARHERSQKSYRATLDRLFESGKISKLLDDPSPTAGEGSDRLPLLRAVQQAEGRDAVTGALDAYLARYELPDEFEVLEKALEHRSASVQLKALEGLEGLLARERPRRTRGLIGQLKLIRDATSEERLRELATSILERLDS